ncbi:hypothetical protein [Paraburkholderia sp. PGU19]|uniref:hypothetical protein n=1 Tax=Paraburkholderia sp. PGU19 TaxID=2735434 RepID=UPI0015D975B9|nr:hypothetical protein [Paraburkholderia sp. PGU19]
MSRQIRRAGCHAKTCQADAHPLEQCYGVKVEILRDPARGGVLVVPSHPAMATTQSKRFNH